MVGKSDSVGDSENVSIDSHRFLLDLAAATPEEVYTYIKSVSYPNNKSKHLVGMARTLIEQFNGVVPSEIEDLQKLPGVGRKTANVIASVVFNKEAMAVDTHVGNASNRAGVIMFTRLSVHCADRMTAISN